MGLLGSIVDAVKSAVAEPEVSSGEEIVKHYSKKASSAKGVGTPLLKKRLAGKKLTFKNGVLIGLLYESDFNCVESKKRKEDRFVATVKFDNPEDNGKTAFFVNAFLGDSVSKAELLSWRWGMTVASLKGVVIDNGENYGFHLGDAAVAFKKGTAMQGFDLAGKTEQEVLGALIGLARTGLEIHDETIKEVLKGKEVEFEGGTVNVVNSESEGTCFEFDVNEDISVKAFFSKASGKGIERGKAFKKVTGKFVESSSGDITIKSAKVQWE